VGASNAGAESDPAWWLNLRDQPDAEVEIGGRRRTVRARPATAEEAARLWPRLVAANPDYAAYRARARRPIPLITSSHARQAARSSSGWRQNAACTPRMYAS
jgi:deazaflavin-dependent oxidoreductase (nitroreductase family)